ncbi:fibronectin type III domain-containing protein 10 isoform X2 [Takifugu rubripes]|uniref:fibronectin type III domain-containing protein 10 isoform X2 n=1 Tax=Takifugu rubripes TaxID=31033 RepID=UPI00114538F7|nr:fibronectin type III domain-containing protein 10 isoform X2 [Takifugu rubripes]
MKSLQSLIALSALLLFTSHQRAASGHSSPASSTPSPSSEERGRNNLGTPQNWVSESNRSISYGKQSHGRRTSAKPEETSRTSSNTRKGIVSTVIHESPGAGASPLCAYRVMEGGIGGKLCFRHTLHGYKCHKGDCRTVLTMENLVANILINGSVLLQWQQDKANTAAEDGTAVGMSSRGPGTNLTKEERLRGGAVGGHGRRRRGYELSCWWNGSYTQFECAGVLLGPGCRDFLLTELHERIPYRICLRSLARSSPPQEVDRQNCVEFTLSPSGMQDIVIAMTTVGGAICVMLVIICLLVAYITENIMSPTTQHTYSYRTRTHH